MGGDLEPNTFNDCPEKAFRPKVIVGMVESIDNSHPWDCKIYQNKRDSKLTTMLPIIGTIIGFATDYTVNLFPCVVVWVSPNYENDFKIGVIFPRFVKVLKNKKYILAEDLTVTESLPIELLKGGCLEETFYSKKIENYDDNKIEYNIIKLDLSKTPYYTWAVFGHPNDDFTFLPQKHKFIKGMVYQ
ncbi:hypothetical protein PV-S19_0097 [Pacmanvirus S19]|nr:hypothetical protein PV-S19_0097 [Pacmanvirus S19]